MTAMKRTGGGRTKKQRYLYRKKLLRRQEHALLELRGPGSEAAMASARASARDLAHRMVKHGLSGRCLLLHFLVEEIMES